jgi:hypothetical protein
MGIRAWPTFGKYLVANPREGDVRGLAGVDDCESFLVVDPYPNVQRGGICSDPGDFKPQNFASHDSVLSGHIQLRSTQLTEHLEGNVGDGLVGHGSGAGLNERPALEPPDMDICSESTCASSRDRLVGIDDQVQSIGTFGISYGQGLTQGRVICRIDQDVRG